MLLAREKATARISVKNCLGFVQEQTPHTDTVSPSTLANFMLWLDVHFHLLLEGGALLG